MCFVNPIYNAAKGREVDNFGLDAWEEEASEMDESADENLAPAPAEILQAESRSPEA